MKRAHDLLTPNDSKRVSADLAIQRGGLAGTRLVGITYAFSISEGFPIIKVQG